MLARNALRPGAAAVPEPAVRAQLDALAAALAADPTSGWAGFAAVHRLRTPAEADAVVVRRLTPG